MEVSCSRSFSEGSLLHKLAGAALGKVAYQFQLAAPIRTRPAAVRQALGQRERLAGPRRVADLSQTLASGFGATALTPLFLGSCTGNGCPGLELGAGSLSNKAGVVMSRPTPPFPDQV